MKNKRRDLEKVMTKKQEIMKNKIRMSNKEFFIKKTKLTSMDIAGCYIEEKNAEKVRKILQEYKLFTDAFEEDDKRKYVLSCQISKLNRALRRLNSRTEEEIENDFMEQELLQIAMYG